MEHSDQNPLALYLEENAIRRADFARKLGVTRARVTQICTGWVAHLELAKRIETETGGAVPAAAWLDRAERTPEQAA